MLPWSGILPIKTVRHFLTALRPSGFTLSQTSSPITKHRVRVRCSQRAHILLLEPTGYLRNPDTSDYEYKNNTNMENMAIIKSVE